MTRLRTAFGRKSIIWIYDMVYYDIIFLIPHFLKYSAVLHAGRTGCSSNIVFFLQEFSIFFDISFARTGLLLVVQKMEMASQLGWLYTQIRWVDLLHAGDGLQLKKNTIFKEHPVYKTYARQINKRNQYHWQYYKRISRYIY